MKKEIFQFSTCLLERKEYGKIISEINANWIVIERQCWIIK